jgi:hypothetical protein
MEPKSLQQKDTVGNEASFGMILRLKDRSTFPAPYIFLIIPFLVSRARCNDANGVPMDWASNLQMDWKAPTFDWLFSETDHSQTQYGRNTR